MTNLDIIKYIAFNNPTRLSELLDDIYCNAWTCGSYAASRDDGEILGESEIEDFNVWLNQEASESGFYYDHELKEWSKLIEKENPLRDSNDKELIDSDGQMFDCDGRCLNCDYYDSLDCPDRK